MGLHTEAADEQLGFAAREGEGVEIAEEFKDDGLVDGGDVESKPGGFVGLDVEFAGGLEGKRSGRFGFWGLRLREEGKAEKEDGSETAHLASVHETGPPNPLWARRECWVSF